MRLGNFRSLLKTLFKTAHQKWQKHWRLKTLPESATKRIEELTGRAVKKAGTYKEGQWLFYETQFRDGATEKFAIEWNLDTEEQRKKVHEFFKGLSNLAINSITSNL